MKLSLGIAALIIAGCCAFFNAVNHPFVHDDVVFIVQNPHIGELSRIPDVFIPQEAPKAGINVYYRPILEIVYRLEYAVFGFHAPGYHLVNILMHILNGILIFLLLEFLGWARGVAWVVALFFVIHPVQSEAVACVAGISNVLMAFFVLLCLHAYARGWISVAMALFVVALFTKEQALMAVPLIVLVDCWKKKPRWQKAMSWFLFAATSLVFLHWRSMIFARSVIGDILSSPSELMLRLKAVASVLLMDVRIILAPYDLHYYRSTDVLLASAWWWVVLAIAVVFIFFVGARHKEWQGFLIFGGVWFLAALMPVLNFIPLINEYALILTADHFLYVPIVGILLIVVNIGQKILPAAIAKVVLLIMVISCVGLTIYQNRFWKNEQVLFERVVEFEPSFGRAHTLLAKAYFAAGKYEKALDKFAIAYEIMKGYEQKATNDQARLFYHQLRRENLINIGDCYKALHDTKALAGVMMTLNALDGPRHR